jgi:ATP-binding cassette subfamily C protein
VNHRLPIADRAAARRAALRLIRVERGAFATVLLLGALAALAGVAGPWLLGRIVDAVRAHRGTAAVDHLAPAILLCTLAQLLLARYARLLTHRFGERTAARVREQYLRRALALPAAIVERAGTGDLTTRGTVDADAVAATLRELGPEVLVAVIQSLLILGAALAVDPRLGACGLLGLLGILLAWRWYLRRARAAYLTEASTTSELAEMLTATATGARTIEALGLQHRRLAVGHRVLADAAAARRRTLALRNVLFPIVDVCYAFPVVAVLLLGSLLHARGEVGAGTVVAVALYLRQLSGPLEELMFRSDQLQSSSAAFARLEGLAGAEEAARRPGAVPADDRIEVRRVGFGYEDGPEVLHGVDLTVRPGERLAVVGPSGAGKSTLGRLLAGVERPRTGTVTVGGVPIAELDPEQLRRQVVLVTQEQHVFLGTVRENLLLAAPDASDAELDAALAAVGAAWARELLAGRTVIAIAHRLHTAHDADQVAVLADGRLVELGSHEQLVARGGAYAALWVGWLGGGGTEPEPAARPGPAAVTPAPEATGRW